MSKMTQEEREQWLAIRKEAGIKIDPGTAEVDWTYAQVVDPYGIHPDLPPECDCVGRAYFARAPGSDIWVCFRDLPDITRNALWERHAKKLAFPAGLPRVQSPISRWMMIIGGFFLQFAICRRCIVLWFDIFGRFSRLHG